EKKKPKAKEPYAGLFSFGKKITLTDKQKEQLEALKKDYVPKLVEQDKKRDAILTPERVKEAKAARKKVLDEGKGKDLDKKEKKEPAAKANKAYNEALKITKEEKKELGETNKARHALVKEINTKKMALLTDEQKAALKPKPKKDKGKDK